MSRRVSWFAVRTELPPHRRTLLTVLAFLLPLGLWCVVSYVPWIWHPYVMVTDGGDTYLIADMLAEQQAFAETNAAAVAEGKRPAEGYPANPAFFPPPHKVATAFYTAFVTPPQLRDDPWFHASIWHSITIIFWGFFWACLLGVPLGVLCGTFSLFSRLLEPFVDFIRYMPAPAFGALMVAIFGITDAPKIAIIFIGTFFQMVLVIANTTRLLDKSLLEAAQTLGASRRQLVTSVIIPGVLPNVYNDLRILLGWAWTYLIVAELIGSKSGISSYIAQQSRYFHFDRVYAAILIIGLIGLTTDQVLQVLGQFLFPYQRRAAGGFARGVWSGLTWVPRRFTAYLTGPREPAVPLSTPNRGVDVAAS